jgi:hypothetical protein
VLRHRKVPATPESLSEGFHGAFARQSGEGYDDADGGWARTRIRMLLPGEVVEVAS